MVRSDLLTPATTPSQREFVRYEPVFWVSPIELKADARKFEAMVKDESLGGLGVVVAEAFGVEAGQEVMVVSNTLRRKAKFAYVVEEPGGRRRIGLTWLPDSAYI